MKISKQRKNRRKRFALQPTCPNCGEQGRHELPRSLEMVLTGRRWFACDPKRERMVALIETSAGPVEATIKGDPDMSPETRNTLTKMMSILANNAILP